MFLRAYFDESIRKDVDTFTVAGYAFLPDQVKRFDRSWRKMLGPYQVFHMADFNSGRNEFKNISKDLQHSMIREAVRIINARVLVGVSASCSAEAFEEMRPRELRFHRDPYPFLCHLCIVKISDLLDSNRLRGNVAYVFEAGHRCQGDADRLMQLVHADPHVSRRFRYKDHSFVPKEGAAPLQAADFLAWEWGKYAGERDRRPMRKSLEALIEHDRARMWCVNMGQEHIRRWFELAEENNLYRELFKG